MFASSVQISSHSIASETLEDTITSGFTRPVSDEALRRPVADPHNGNSQSTPLIPREASSEHQKSEHYLSPTSALLTSCQVSPTNGRVEDHSSSCRETLPCRLSIAQMVCTYTDLPRRLVDDEACNAPTPCHELTTEHTVINDTWSEPEPATLGLPILEVDLLSSLGERGDVVALRDNPKRKPSAAELFPRTNYQDKEECWDESGFLGLETDERLLEEMGETIVNVKEKSQEQYNRVCSDPCWR